jgi:hypothetical protein
LKKASAHKEISQKRQPSESFINDPEGFFSCLSPKVISILDTLLIADNNYKKVFLTHDTIAERSGCHRTTVKRLMPLLIKAGLVGKIGRFYRSSLFRISDYFHDPHNRTKLAHLFKAFCFLPLLLLSVCNGSWVKDYSFKPGSNGPLTVNSFYNKNINSNLLGSNISNSTGKQTMKLESYPNMHKKALGSWGGERPKSSIKSYADVNRPQCDGGSVESELNRKRRCLDEEAQIKREFEAEIKALPSSDWIKQHLRNQGWLK